MDMRALEERFSLSEDGIWLLRSGERTAISFPEEGNRHQYEVEDHSFWYKHRNACIVATVRNFPPPGTLIDVGGGNGYVSEGIFQAGFDVALIEPGEVGTENARRRGIATVIRSTFQDAGFPQRSLPAAGLFDVVEHIQDDSGLLREVCTALIDGGRLYLTVPTFSHLWSAHDDLVGHYHRYRLGEVRSKLESAGFVVEYGSYFFSFLYAPVLLLRTLPTKLGVKRVDTETQGEKLYAERGKHHRSATPFVNPVMNLVGQFELSRLRARTQIPFGTSLIVVAKARH